MNQIGTNYQTASGTVQFVHGGGGVNPLAPLNLRAGEFITSISGTSGSYINQLTLKINYGQSVTYPPSPNSAPAFSWTVPAGATLMGFQGTCGSYLNQLQPVYHQFQPAIWVQYVSVAQYIPAGSYQNTSSGITVTIFANCLNAQGNSVASTLTYTTTQAATISDIEKKKGGADYRQYLSLGRRAFGMAASPRSTRGRYFAKPRKMMGKHPPNFSHNPVFIDQNNIH